MDEFRHNVSGFFEYREAAETARARLIERGLPPDRLYLVSAATAKAANGEIGGENPSPPDSNRVLKDVVVDGAIGTAVGTGVGAVGQLALVAANVSLFVASPLLAPLAMLGWGAALGGVVGAAVGTSKSTEEPFAALLDDAVTAGQHVLVVDTRSEVERDIAREVMEDSVGGYEEVNKNP